MGHAAGAYLCYTHQPYNKNLTEKEFLALWDALLNGIKPRPKNQWGGNIINNKKRQSWQNQVFVFDGQYGVGFPISFPALSTLLATRAKYIARNQIDGK